MSSLYAAFMLWNSGIDLYTQAERQQCQFDFYYNAKIMQNKYAYKYNTTWVHYISFLQRHIAASEATRKGKKANIIRGEIP